MSCVTGFIDQENFGLESFGEGTVVKSHTKRLGLVAASACLTTLAVATPVFADPTTLIVNLIGSWSIDPPSVVKPFNDGEGFTLNGQVQTLTATLSDWSVVNAGFLLGWHVTLQASQLAEVPPSKGWANGTSQLKLPLGSLALSGTRQIVPGLLSMPVDPQNGPMLENQSAPIDVQNAVTIVDTQPLYGVGTYTIKEPQDGLTLTLQPGTTFVDPINYPDSGTPYATTLTYSFVFGP
jgi:hypothetical protein